MRNRLRGCLRLLGILNCHAGTGSWQETFFYPLMSVQDIRTSIRISRGTGSLRVVSQGLSHPVLENFPFLILAFSIY